jgi:transcriptional regulator with XRE-family HTH domain
VPRTSELLSQPGGLAERLYSLRKAAGLTGDQLAADLGWPRSKISKIENGHQMPTEQDIRAWSAGCDRPEAASELLDMLADVETASRQWRKELRKGHAAIQTDLDQRTRQATHIRNAEIAVIPGLLQTAAYARSIVLESASVNGMAHEDVEAAVTARMNRQNILYENAKTFEFVITEAALRLMPCPAQVMLGQLDRLLSLGMDNLTLGIIPMGVQLTMTPVHGFLIIDDVALVETYHQENEVREPGIATYERIFDRLMAEAVTGEQARRLISAAAKDLRSKRPSSA